MFSPRMLAKQLVNWNRFPCRVVNKNTQVQVRTVTYLRSEPVGDPSKYTDYEIVHNPEEWKYVERLLPLKWIPEVKPKESYPSGWIPQTASPSDLPYFVERTKNYMLPVYMDIGVRGRQRTTKLRNVEGDIWKLSKEVHEYLLQVSGKTAVGVKVDEMKKTIFFRGDYVEYIKKFLIDKGL